MTAGRLRGKVAIVTGAGSGLGRSTAQVFAREGAQVLGCGRTLASLEETAKSIADQGGEIEVVTGDVSRADDVDRIVGTAVDRYGRVDALVNNAALLNSRRESEVGSMGTTMEITEEDWTEVIDVNLRSVFLTCKRILPVMHRQGGGAIVNGHVIAAGAWFTEPSPDIYGIAVSPTQACELGQACRPEH